METITIYLENMFAAFPQTPEILNLKEEMLCNMEDKYNELKQAGKTENEAIGIVISEFGNIDELVQELGINFTSDGYQEDYKDMFIEQDQAAQIIMDYKRYGNMVGAGVALCILAPAFMVLFGSIFSSNYHIGMNYNVEALSAIPVLLPLFLLLAVGVGLLIYSGVRMEQYKFLKHEATLLTPAARNYVHNCQNEFLPKNTMLTTIGVVMCILSPMLLIITVILGESIGMGDIGGGIGVFSLLFLIAIATFLFIIASEEEDIYKMLLQEKKEKKREHDSGKISSLINSIGWPITVCIYLVISFSTSSWGRSWIIWPVAAIIIGTLSKIVESIYSFKQE